MISYRALSKNPLIKYLKGHYVLLAFFSLFFLHIFLQFYKLDSFITFGWDQTDNAWAAKHIIVNHEFPLIGMVAKGNSGFNIGPLYYYFIAIFYWMFNLNPIASPVSAGVASILTFLVFFFLTKKMFSSKVALLMVFIQTCSFFITINDRVQWPVNFIPVISIVIFYALYQILLGKGKFLLLLGIALGLSIQVHFTSIFYFPIILLTLPLFPKRRTIILLGIASFFIFFCFLLPNLIYEGKTAHSQSVNIANYIRTYYHGFHVRRVLQLTHDGFIEFDLLLRNRVTSTLSFIFVPLFCLVYFFKEKTKKRFLFCYLTILWFVIPWFAFSTYKGEISNYYFFMTRPLVLIILSYLTYFLYTRKNIYIRIVVICLWLYFSYANISDFVTYDKQGGLSAQMRATVVNIQNGSKMKTEQNIPEQYFLYYYSRNEK